MIIIKEMLDFFKERFRLEVNFYNEQIQGLKSLLNEFKISQKDDKDREKIASLYDKLRFETDETNRFYLEKAISQAEESFNERKATEHINSQIQAYKEMIAAAKESHNAQVISIKETYDEQARLNENYTNITNTLRNSTSSLFKDLNVLFDRGFSDIVKQIESFSRNFSAVGSFLGREFTEAFMRETSVINNISNVGGITQNFYQNELSPWNARLMAEDLLDRVNKF